MAYSGIIFVFGAQSKPEESNRANRLLDILERRNGTLFPEFCQALEDTKQGHVVDLLQGNDTSCAQTLDEKPRGLFSSDSASKFNEVKF